MSDNYKEFTIYIYTLEIIKYIQIKGLLLWILVVWVGVIGRVFILKVTNHTTLTRSEVNQINFC